MKDTSLLGLNADSTANTASQWLNSDATDAQLVSSAAAAAAAAAAQVATDAAEATASTLGDAIGWAGAALAWNSVYQDYVALQTSDTTANQVALAGDVHLEARSAFTPYFNFTGGDFAQNTAWIGSGTAFLATLGTDGKIDGTDLINSFSQLAALDSNSDGVIDASDPAYANLVIWQDLNNDGIAESNEILTLQQAGIVSISLSTTSSSSQVDGQKVTATATATMIDGTTREIASVELDASPYYTKYVGSYSEDSTVQALPNLKG